ncbi:hypothetical protein QFC19_001186 [Naganishia cerealis]|uniref:Uncharacterized protein n=1 Tax=Naganishia cerealis TaxID=610337 RepID=A0ACC2WK24_9TREE|nr:hypothetical protein QFC19_001186 [Naganishia cerealis]
MVGRADHKRRPANLPPPPLTAPWEQIRAAPSVSQPHTVGSSGLSQVTGWSVEAISHPDPKDATCASAPARRRAEEVQAQARRRVPGLLNGRLDGLRIGLPIQVQETHLPPEHTPLPLGPLLAHLRSLGATLVPISIPTIPLCLPAYYVLACAEASSTLARFGGGWYGFESAKGSPRQDIRREGFGREVRKRIVAGTWALTAGYVHTRRSSLVPLRPWLTLTLLPVVHGNSAFDNSYLKALQLRHTLRADFQAVFRAPHPLTTELEQGKTPPPPDERGVDVILHPTAIRTAPPLPTTSNDDDDDDDVSPSAAAPSIASSEYVQDILTVPASLAGLPSLSVPYGVSTTDGWPVGVSLTAQWGMEDVALDVAKIGVESFYQAGQAVRRACLISEPQGSE